MPEFTPDYMQLCRELRMKRAVALPGDYCLPWHDPEHVYIHVGNSWEHPTEGWFRAGGFEQRDERIWDVWLPTGDQWDELLLIASGGRTLYVTRLVDGQYRVGTDEVGPHVDATSVLEAKARLWLALTGRAPDA